MMIGWSVIFVLMEFEMAQAFSLIELRPYRHLL